MSTSFTSPDDLCGSRLQSLVCRGHCLIIKVLKASNEIPPVFLSSSGYAIDDFTTESFMSNDANANNSNNKNKSSSFFGSTVKNIFGSGGQQEETQPVKKIRSQAPSYRQTCSSGSGSGSGTTTTDTSHNRQFGSGSSGNIHSSGDNVGDNDNSNKFMSILADFSYLSNPDKFDGNNNNHNSKKNSTSSGDKYTKEEEEELQIKRRKYAAEQENSEREFALTYQSILKKYYTLFEEIYHFYLDVNSFTYDLNGGHFVQYNLRSLLLECNEARQLLCEIVYLCGSLLILLDMYIPVRKKSCCNLQLFKNSLIECISLCSCF